MATLSGGHFWWFKSGGVLLSHKVTLAVPSAQRVLASGFGMGPGVSLSLWPPKHLLIYQSVYGQIPPRTQMMGVQGCDLSVVTRP